jgi:hypothetical protein
VKIADNIQATISGKPATVTVENSDAVGVTFKKTGAHISLLWPSGYKGLNGNNGISHPQQQLQAVH